MCMYFVKSEHDMKAAPWIGKELLIEQIGIAKTVLEVFHYGGLLSHNQNLPISGHRFKNFQDLCILAWYSKYRTLMHFIVDWVASYRFWLL